MLIFKYLRIQYYIASTTNNFFQMKRYNYLFAILILFTASCAKQPIETITENTPWGDQVFKLPAFKEQDFNIVDFGAKKNIETNNQTAIQATIDACNKQGGGTVIVSEGTWRTSYINLKSNVNFHLSEGAVISFIDSIPLYAVPTFTRWEGLECMNYHPFIYARNQENISITGKGIIEGNAQVWWDLAKGTQKSSLKKLYDLVEAGVAPEDRNCLAFEPTSYLRPSMVQFIDCERILVEGIELHSGPMWTTHFVYCENVVARNLRVITDGTNNDGIIPDACNGFLVDNCYFSTGDDCIVIKSGLNEDGWRVGKASENIIIKNVKTKHGHGGVVIGSEMSGGVRNVYAHHCDFSQTDRGLRIKSMKGRGGVIENIWFEDIKMDNIKREAIKINMHYGSSSIQPRTDSLPTFRNLHYKNITSNQSQYGIRIQGIDSQYVDQIFFENVELVSERGIYIENTQNATFKNINSKNENYFPLSLINVSDISFDEIQIESEFMNVIHYDKAIKNIKINGLKTSNVDAIYKNGKPSSEISIN